MNINSIINNVKSFPYNRRHVFFIICASLFITIITGILVWRIFYDRSISNNKTTNYVVAEVNGQKLYTNDIIPYIYAAKERLDYERVLKRKSGEPSAYEILTRALNEMINATVQGQKAKEYNISLSNQDINKILQQFSNASEEYKKYYKDNALADKLKEKLTMDEKKAISESDIEAFYEKFKSKFISWPKYNIQQIVISLLDTSGKPISQEDKDKAKSMAENIFNQVESGEAFDELAKKYSYDSQTRDNGGYTGLVESNQLNAQIADQLSSIKIGELKLEVTPDAYIIFRLVDKADQRLKTLDEARDEITYAISQGISNQNSYENTLKKWVSQSNIKKYYDALGKIDITKMK